MKLGNLKQVILYVEDMQKQVEFYRDTLGLSITFPHVDNYANEDWVAFSTGECTLALHSGGKGRIGEDAPRFTFEVDNVEQIKEELQGKGVEMANTVEAYPGSYVCGGMDPEDNGFYIQSFPH